MALANPEVLAIPLLPPQPVSGQTRQEWFRDVVNPYVEFQRDFINQLPANISAKFFTSKMLRGKRSEQVKNFIFDHFSKSTNLTPDEIGFLGGLTKDRGLEEQGVTIASVKDYSSGRGTAQGAVVYKINFVRGDHHISLFLKGVDPTYRRAPKKEEFYETFFYELANLLGLNSIASDYYGDTEDGVMLGYTLMQEVVGEDTNHLFDRVGLKFRVKESLRKYKSNLIREFAQLSTISDLLNKGDRRIIQNKNPQYPANNMVNLTRLNNGQPAIFSMDHTFLFNRDDGSVINDLERDGNPELGIIQAFDEFETPAGREQLFAEFESAYLAAWENVKTKSAEIERLTVAYFGEDSYEHNIIRNTLQQDPKQILNKQKAALLRFVDRRGLEETKKWLIDSNDNEKWKYASSLLGGAANPKSDQQRQFYDYNDNLPSNLIHPHTEETVRSIEATHRQELQDYIQLQYPGVSIKGIYIDPMVRTEDIIGLITTGHSEYVESQVEYGETLAFKRKELFAAELASLRRIEQRGVVWQEIRVGYDSFGGGESMGWTEGTTRVPFVEGQRFDLIRLEHALLAILEEMYRHGFKASFQIHGCNWGCADGSKYLARGQFYGLDNRELSAVDGKKAEYLYRVLADEWFKKNNGVLEDIREFSAGKGTLPQSEDNIKDFISRKVVFKGKNEGTSERDKALPAEQDLGGINLNPNMLELQTQGEGMDFDIPIDPQVIETIQIDGFSPVIFQIIPTNLPLLIGGAQSNQPGQQLTSTQ